MGAVGRGLLGLDLTHHLCVCDIIEAVGRDVFVFDYPKAVSTGNMFTFSVIAFSDALLEAAKFISIR